MSLMVNAGRRAISLGLGNRGSAMLQKYVDSVRLNELLRRLKIDCMLDVGANNGQFGAKLRAMGFKGYILSFEPIAADADRVRERAKNDPRWHVFPIALGNEDGEKQFNVIGADYTVLSSFLQPSLDEMPSDREAITVPIRRLDSMFDEITAIAGADARIFLKMDTQGYDLEVARGCARHMSRILGLQSEVSVFELYTGQPRYTEALEYFEQFGFSLMDLLIVNRRPAGNILEYDALFARTGQLAT